MSEQIEKSFSEPEEIVELSFLFDFYGALLKEEHQRIFEDYVENNLSLSEIAKQRNITRQGIYDIVKRCRKKLREYEDKLQLIGKFRDAREKLEKIEDIANSCENEEVKNSIPLLTQEIYEIL